MYQPICVLMSMIFTGSHLFFDELLFSVEKSQYHRMWAQKLQQLCEPSIIRISSKNVKPYIIKTIASREKYGFIISFLLGFFVVVFFFL